MYIDRIGKPPAPMLLDYPKLIEERSVWVVELAAEIEGVLVQFETPTGSTSIPWHPAREPAERALVEHCFSLPSEKQFEEGMRLCTCAQTPR